MTMIGIGDLAQTFLLRRANAEGRAQAQRLGQEVSTGLTSDPVSHLGGDYRLFAALERQLGLIETQAGSARTAASLASVQQDALGRVSDQLDAMVAERGALPLSPDPDQISTVSRNAAHRLDEMVAALRSSHAGKFVFSGDMPENMPVASAGDMMTALRAAVAGETDPAAIATTVEQWFADPAGGYATTGYLGSDRSMTPVPLGDTRVSLGIRADDPALRSALASAALGALASDPDLGLPPETGHALLRRAAGTATAAQGAVTRLRAGLGTDEARLEATVTRLASERAAAEMARVELLAVDPYETAVQLEATSTRLETLYAVTARLSRLTLAERV